MRLPAALFKARTPQNENEVPFKAMMPFRLRDRVSGKGDGIKQVACLQEMAVLLACFKANEFDESFCTPEITKFQQCYDSHTKQTRERKEMERKGILAPGAKKLSHRQLTKYLRRYPDQ